MELTKAALRNKVAKLTQQIAHDGWANLLTGYGVSGKDKRVAGSYCPERRILEKEATDLYRGDGLGKRVIDVLIFDMLRKWFIIENDTEDIIQPEFKRLKYHKFLKGGLTWADVYGGSIIIMGLNDGATKLEEPLNEDALKSIEFLRVYDRWQVNVTQEDLYRDPARNKFGEPEFYNVIPIATGGTADTQFRVHETRVLRFDGELLPDHSAQANEYWFDSVYQAIFDRLRGLGMTYGNIELIIEEFVIGILKIDNLMSLVQSGQTAHIKERMNLLDLSKHILNTYLIDSEEDFARISSSVTGLEEILGKLESALAGVRGIPVSILFGTQQKGMNAGGAEGEQTRRYYDKVTALQGDKYLDQTERLMYLIQKAKEGPAHGNVNEDFKIKFNPLYVPTQDQEADTKKKQSDTDKNYIDTNVLTPDEVAKARFGGEYNLDTQLSDSHEAAIEEREEVMTEATLSGITSGEPDDNKIKDLEGEEEDNTPINKGM